MKKGLSFFTLALCMAFAAITGPARADLTIKFHMSVDAPQLQSMAPQAVAAMNQDMTQYISGEKMRIDTSMMSMLMDSSAQKMTMLMNPSKQYMVTSLDPATIRSMMPGEPGAGFAGAKIISYKVIDTGKTTTFLGHKVRHYVTTMTMSVGSMGTMTVQSDILAAQDLPASDMVVINKLWAMETTAEHVEGLPLETTATMTGGLTGTMTIKESATSISTDPVDTSVFQIPDGYTQMQMPASPDTSTPPSAPVQ